MSARLRSPSLVVALIVAGVSACERGESAGIPPAAATSAVAGRIWIQPGPAPAETLRVVNPYAGDPRAIAQGELLYNSFNCAGCHGGTGGAMGPNLEDEHWIYGGDAASIYASIMQGRPAGMPTWRGMLPEQSAWMIVAYLQSLQPSGGGARQGRQSGR